MHSIPCALAHLWRAATCLLLGTLLSLPAAHALAAPVSQSPAPDAVYATTITVDTSADLDPGSLTKTCSFTAGAFFAAGDGCTLRRALLEASARPQSDRPILIRFNLANNDPNANLEVNGTWTLPIDDELPPLKTPTILNLNGSVTLDGATQPGGRSNGPKIILATDDWSLEVESENNIIRHLAFKGGGAIFLKENGNTVSDIWMGLTDDGQSVHFRTPGDEFRMAGGGIFIRSDDNTVEDNTIVGAFAKAVDIDGGDNNLVQNNRIGTRADGTVPVVPAPIRCLRSMAYDEQNWYGGWGIALSGSNNSILNNRIAGLHILQSANDTPPIAVEVFGSNHTISGNIIGVDAADTQVGVCGQGIKISGSRAQVVDNIIAGSRVGFEDAVPVAILGTGGLPSFDRNTVRRNLVIDGPGGNYGFGPAVATSLRNFNPAKITAIAGTTVTGTAGTDSPCPGCTVDFYQDDVDAVGEALVYLGAATADAQGNFTFNLSQPLPANTGIRTGSTVPSAGIIAGFGAGTSTAISKLFFPMQSVTVVGPTTGEIGTTYTYTITVGPAAATAPFAYAVTYTDGDAPLTLNTASPQITANLTWAEPGDKEVEVSVTNDLGTVTTTITITIVDPDDPGAGKPALYMPLIQQ